MSSSSDVEEVEAALALFYAFVESISDDAMKLGNGSLGQLVMMLL